MSSRSGAVLILLASSALLSCKRPPPRDAYTFPMAPYAAPYAPPSPNATPAWPLVPVGVSAPPPAATTVAPPSSVAVAPSSAPGPTTTAAPIATGPLASADPEIDGSPDVAYIEFGGVSMIGGTVPDVSASVARMHGTFRRCYRAALVQDFKTKGDLLLTAQIGAKGEVSDAVADNVNGVPGHVVTCMIDRLSKQTFTRPSVTPTTIHIPVLLRPMAPPPPRGPRASR